MDAAVAAILFKPEAIFSNKSTEGFTQWNRNVFIWLQIGFGKILAEFSRVVLPLERGSNVFVVLPPVWHGFILVAQMTAKNCTGPLGMR